MSRPYHVDHITVCPKLLNELRALILKFGEFSNVLAADFKAGLSNPNISVRAVHQHTDIQRHFHRGAQETLVSMLVY